MTGELQLQEITTDEEWNLLEKALEEDEEAEDENEFDEEEEMTEEEGPVTMGGK